MRERNRSRWGWSAAAALAAITGLLVATSLLAGKQGSEPEGYDGKLVAGTYLLADDSGNPRLITLHEDGTSAATSSEEEEWRFSTNHGAWKKVGAREVKVVGLDFSYSDGSTVRVTYDMELADLRQGRFQTVSGEFFVEVFAAGVDPLDPASVPVDTWDALFTGRRVNAD